MIGKRVFVLILCLGLTGAAADPQERAGDRSVENQKLSAAFQDFLKLVTYIITPKENGVFAQLTNDRDRDIFVKSFWNLRDPTPGTPENEYRDEINRRFDYVNKRFGGARPGWKTDRGMYYMILGEPNSYDRYPGKSGIVPCEIWYYYTDGTKGLPVHFGLVFFQKGGYGDYRLYDPFVDGPKALLLSTTSTLRLDPLDYENLYDEIAQFAPALAAMSISLIPGEFGFGYQPTSQSTMLLAKIADSPRNNINPVYATHFMDYKGMVSTEYLTNYVDSHGLVAVIRDPILNLPFVHFSLSPSTLTMDFYDKKKQHFCDLKFDVSLRWRDKVVSQYSRQFPLYLSENEVERYRRSGISFEDSFPVMEGDYTLTVLMQNTTNKEFSVYERAISVPQTSNQPALEGPFVGYKIESFESNTHLPFKAIDRKLDVDPKMVFSASDQIAVLFNIINMTEEMWKNGEVALSLQGQGSAPTAKSVSFRLSDYPYNAVLNLSWIIAGAELAPDYYKIRLSLIGPDKSVQDEKSAEFAIFMQKAVPHPIAISKGFSLANQFYFYYQLGRSYSVLDQNEQAEAHFAKGYAQNPSYQEGILDYSRFLLKLNHFDKVLEIIENIKGSDQGRFEYLLVKGLAVMGKGDFDPAIALLQEANKIYNSDTVLLNALGACYFRTGQRDQALAAYKASLRINEKQDDVRQTIANLEKMK